MIDRRALCLAAFGLVLTLAACGGDDVCDECKPRLSGPLELTGSVTWPSTPELPPDAELSIELVRVQGAGAVNNVVVRTKMAAAGTAQPVPYKLSYNGGSIEPNTLYYVIGRIKKGDKLLMINDRGYGLPGNGTGPLDLALVPVPTQAGKN